VNLYCDPYGDIKKRADKDRERITLTEKHDISCLKAALGQKDVYTFKTQKQKTHHSVIDHL
jgi:hypothetical protein